MNINESHLNRLKNTTNEISFYENVMEILSVEFFSKALSIADIPKMETFLKQLLFEAHEGINKDDIKVKFIFGGSLLYGNLYTALLMFGINNEQVLKENLFEYNSLLANFKFDLTGTIYVTPKYDIEYIKENF